ncbi:lymphoid-specific helicase-like isoform X2 [Bacillus rossius redtenbacheri]|uniref:lymphoid-specific helicase-like isoform X2 n=1 Tax=Bacillus rossius redtenbacheri TaxID=93214 RepID=UPI002FDE7F85
MSGGAAAAASASDAAGKEDELSSSDTEQQSEVELNEEERKERFEKLTKLLSKSKAYTNYLQLKLTKDKMNEENAAKRGRKGAKAKEGPADTEAPGDRTSRKRVLQERNAGSPGEAEAGCKRSKPCSVLLSDVDRAGSEENVAAADVRAGPEMRSSAVPRLFQNGKLRPYQQEGLQWLRALYENGVNGILADEMGLGKTVQVIAFICHLYEAGLAGPFMVVCPLSTLHNWRKEFQRFAPQIPMKDSRFLGQFYWKYVVVDEAQRMKNHKCLFVSKLKELKCDNRLLLTGTPLQNDLIELWALLNFLMPELFSDSGIFEILFDVRELQNDSNNEKIVEQEKSQQVLSTLHEILAPFMLRRVKADVELELPPKREVLVYAPMTEIQHELYRATLEYNIGLLQRKKEVVSEPVDEKRALRKCRRNINYALLQSDAESGSDSVSEASPSPLEQKEEEVAVVGGNYYVTLKMQNPLMQLRKIVNHPYLVHFPVHPGTKKPLIDEKVIAASGKFLVLDTMLRKLKERGHKVLLFSTFVMVLDLVEELLDIRGFSYCRLDGSASLDRREGSVQRFSADASVFVFLLSTRAGGLGINLTAADTVIIFDSDWNPQVDLQAQDRCHRIGQERPVMVYRLVTRGTIDQKIVERATAKRKLEKMVIQNGKFKMNCFEEDIGDPNELMRLLNSKDYDQEVESCSSGVFTEEELELLLDRSAATPRREAGKTTSSKFRLVGQDSPPSSRA